MRNVKHRLMIRIILIITSLLLFLSQSNGEVLARFIWSG